MSQEATYLSASTSSGFVIYIVLLPTLIILRAGIALIATDRRDGREITHELAKYFEDMHV